MIIKPINDQVYLLEEKESQTASGIILSNEKKSGFFTVYAVGENEYGLKEGDRVIASRYTGEDVEIKDDKPLQLKVCPLDSISAIIHD